MLVYASLRAEVSYFLASRRRKYETSARRLSLCMLWRFTSTLQHLGTVLHHLLPSGAGSLSTVELRLYDHRRAMKIWSYYGATTF